MPEIIDILAPDTSACPYFIVNTAVENVPVDYPGAPAPILRNASAECNFQKGDAFSILSSGIAMPEQFLAAKDEAIATALPWNILYLVGMDSGERYFIDNLGYCQGFYLPLENFEIALDVFVNVPKLKRIFPPYSIINEQFHLEIYLTNLYVSMKNIPAALNQKKYIVVPFLKILHNFLLQSEV